MLPPPLTRFWAPHHSRAPHHTHTYTTNQQNDLEEFYSMVHFTNPNVLGNKSKFRRHYQSPILLGREPDSTDSERAKVGCLLGSWWG